MAIHLAEFDYSEIAFGVKDDGRAGGRSRGRGNGGCTRRRAACVINSQWDVWWGGATIERAAEFRAGGAGRESNMLIREDPIDVVNRSRQTVPAASYRKGRAMERFKSQPLDPSMLVSRDWP